MHDTSLSSSVIICTCNRLEDIVTCLQSIAQQTTMPDEIIIVDSSDTPLDTKKAFNNIFTQETFNTSKLIYQHTQTKSSTFQRNVGIKFASKKIAHFLDDDVILENDYIAQMNYTFIKYPTYAGGMGSVTNIPKKNNDAYRFFRHFFLLQRLYSSGNFTLSGQPTHAYGQTTFKTVEALGGCCMAYRRKVLNKHRFDEHLTRYAYMEDCDLSYRISRDAPLFYNPKARMQHMQSPINRDKLIDIKAIYMRNYIYLFFKNFYPQNKLKIIPFAWSIFGLFIESLLYGRFNVAKGYLQGMRIPLKFFFIQNKHVK